METPMVMRSQGTEERTDRRSYQWMLRTMGRHLDVARAEGVSLLETDNGFVARYYSPGSEELRATVFTLDELHADRAKMEHERRESDGEGNERAPTYENLLRAVGWELDDVIAATVTLDEREGELYLSWLSRDPRQGHVVTKRHAWIGVGELSTMLSDAVGRRRVLGSARSDEDSGQDGQTPL